MPFEMAVYITKKSRYSAVAGCKPEHSFVVDVHQNKYLTQQYYYA